MVAIGYKSSQLILTFMGKIYICIAFILLAFIRAWVLICVYLRVYVDLVWYIYSYFNHFCQQQGRAARLKGTPIRLMLTVAESAGILQIIIVI